MAYSDFKLEDVIDRFELDLHSAELFPTSQPVALSPWLTTTLSHSKRLALLSSTEKARSEFIVAPILLELEQRHTDQIAVFSGKRFDVDPVAGLVGECDFLLAKGNMTNIIQAPVFSMVEAKKQDLELGLGQCAAQMMGAYRFNQKKGQSIATIYGCVTTAESWQFLQLEGHKLTIDSRIYYFNELEAILGIFDTIFHQIPALAPN